MMNLLQRLRDLLRGGQEEDGYYPSESEGYNDENPGSDSGGQRQLLRR